MDYADRYISFLAMPIGVVLCFSPAIILWLIQEYKPSADEKQNDPDKK
jgi:hypothetical protein